MNYADFKRALARLGYHLNHQKIKLLDQEWHNSDNLKEIAALNRINESSDETQLEYIVMATMMLDGSSLE